MTQAPTASLTLTTATSLATSPAGGKDFASSVIYQVYPKSFYSAAGGAYGDLRGVIGDHERKRFTTRRPPSLTRRRCIRLSPIVQYSPLLPPVGVWAVSQSQCDRSPSQAGYPSKPW